MIDGRLMSTVDLLVPVNDPVLCGQTLRAVAIDYNFLPVAVFDAAGNLMQDSASIRIGAGCRIVAISALPDLERLLRREPAKTEFALDIVSFPIPAREWVASLLRVEQKLTAEESVKVVERLPICLKTNLTRGQVADLQSLTAREKVVTAIRSVAIS